MQDIENIKNSYTEVYVWGGDHSGQLGLGKKYIGKSYPTPRICSFNLVIKEVSCGEEHSAFITIRGHVYTMGSNSEGRLGIGDKNMRQSSSPCLVEDIMSFNCFQVSCGWGHTVAVMDNGEAYSWGFGEHGALGTNTLQTKWSPAKITLDNKVFVGVSKASCGSRHTALISEFGNVYTCGAGDAGQLGTGKRDREIRPVQISMISDKVSQVACGIFHTLILTEKGKVFATGGNTFGQLGVGNKKNSNIPIKLKDLDSMIVKKIACGHHSAALTDNSEVYIWGTGVFGEFCSPMKLSPYGTKYKDIDVGSFFGAAVEDSGLVWTWGSNTSGELGLADYEPRKSMTSSSSLQGKNVAKISCGGAYVIALGNVVPTPRKNITSISTEDRLHNTQPQNFSKTPVSNGDLSDLSRTGFTSVGSNEREISSDLSQTIDKKSRIRSRSPYRTGAVRQDGHPSEIKETDGSFNDSRTLIQESDQINRITSLRLNDPFIDLLLKQKNVLESTLKIEKEERKNLEQALHETRKRLRDEQDRNNHIEDSRETMAIQQARIDELYNMLEEERKKNSSLNDELIAQHQNASSLSNNNTDSRRQIEQMQIKINELETNLQNKLVELDELRSASRKQIEKNKSQMTHDSSEIIRLQKAIADMSQNLEKSYAKIGHLEDLRSRDMEDKAILETETLELDRKMNEFMDRLDEAVVSLEKEQSKRAELENQIKALKKSEHEQLEHNKELDEQLGNIKSSMERNLQIEHENASRMQTEIEHLCKIIQMKDQNLDEMNDRVRTLEQDLAENTQKNEQLVGLLNEEIDRQAEECKQRALNATNNSPSRAVESSHVDGVNRSPNSFRKNSVEGRTNEKPSRAQSVFDSNTNTLKEKQQYIYEDSGPEFEDKKPHEQIIRRENLTEEQRRKIRTTVGKLANVLNLQDDTELLATSKTEHSKTPKDSRNTYSSMNKSFNSHHPYDINKDAVVLDTNSEEYLQNLSDVKVRLSTLQKSKHALESKMKDFEIKLKSISKA